MLRRTTNFYVVEFENVGGLVMPIIMRIHYTDNTNELVTFPVQVWRQNSQKIKKLWVTDKEVARMELDPRRETADTEETNNHWPERFIPSRFQLYKSRSGSGGNPMSRARAKEKAKAKEAEAAEAKAAKEKEAAKAKAEAVKEKAAKSEKVEKSEEAKDKSKEAKETKDSKKEKAKDAEKK